MKGKGKRLVAGFLSLVMLVSSSGVVLADDIKRDNTKATESVNFGTEENILYTDARQTGHVHTGERLYVTDLYHHARNGSNLGYILAHFWKQEPQWDETKGIYKENEGEGGAGLQQYMTKEEEHYMVRIPEVKEQIEGQENTVYQWVTFEIYYEDNTLMPFQKKFFIYGSQINHSEDSVCFDFETLKNDTIYIGTGTHCYVASHPINKSASLTNETIFFNFNDIPQNQGGELKPFTDETNASYYKLEWTDEAGVHHDGRIVTRARTEGVWYYTFTGEDNAVEETIFTLRAQNSSPLGIKFIYSRAVKEENMFCVGSILNQQKAWSTYQSAPWTGDITISVNDVLMKEAGQDKIRIQYSMNNSEPNLDDQWENATVENAVDAFPNVYGAQNIPNGAKWVRIGLDNSGVKWSPAYSIVDENSVLRRWDYPCFYMLNTDGGTLNGEWSNVFVGDSAGDDAQIIEEGTYVRDEDSYYAAADFYDYYSTAEMTGHALVKKQEGNYIGSEADANKAGRVFNKALRQLYENTMEIDADGKYSALYLSGAAQCLVDSGLVGNGEDAGTKWKPSNLWHQDDMVTLNLVDDQLNADGQLTMGGGVIRSPFFDRDFLRGENALNMAIGAAYENVIFPFKKNAEGYWEFDSARAEDAVALKMDTNEGYYLEKRTKDQEIRNVNSSAYGFFPYDTYVEGWTNTGSKENKRNSYFGVNLNIPFSITETGTIKSKQADGTVTDTPITFEFSGDDDVWFFIDGKLVLDLGGLHGKCGGTINFKTGSVQYNGNYRLYNREGQEEGSQQQEIGNLNNINGVDLLSTLKDGKTHTFTMYYMERGQWDSNMKIKFNFPRQSKLTVTNTIHTEGADSVFKNSLDNLGGLSFKMYNQAVTGASLPVEEADGYVPGKRADNIVKPNETIPEKSGSDVQEIIWETSVEEGETSRGEILSYKVSNSIDDWKDQTKTDKRIAKIPVKYDAQTFSLNQLAYLYMDVWSDKASTIGADMYVRINGKKENENEKVLCEGSLNQLTYDGNNNILQPGKWNTLRVNLGGISQADKNAGYVISSIEIGFRTENTLKLDNLSLCEPIQHNEMEGFAVEDDKISDYGSVNAQGFQPVEGADYRVYTGLDTETTIKNGSLRRIGRQGYITLGNQEKAVFFDKFRAGSYIHLHQAVIDGQGKIFKTTYDVCERDTEKGYVPIKKDYLIQNRDGVTSVNSTILGVPNDLENIQGRTVEDSRISIRTQKENGNISYERVDKNFTPVSHMLIDGEQENAFVYRNYKEPDILAGAGIDLRVDYVNWLRFGSITIKKKLEYDPVLNEKVTAEQFYNMMNGRSFTFRVYFTNIADRNLEAYTDEEVYKDVTIQVEKVMDENGQVTGLEGVTKIQGIPAGTEYKIYEIPDVGTQLSGITVGVNSIPADGKDAHTGIEGTGIPQIVQPDASGWNGAYAAGKAYASDQEFVFTNKMMDNSGFKVQKIWSNVPENEVNQYTATIQLQSHVVGTDTWEQAKDINGKVIDNITLTGNSEHTYESLPAFFTTKGENNEVIFQALEYRVIEVTDNHPEEFIPIYSVDKEGTQHIVNVKKGQTFYVWEGHKTDLPIGLTGENNTELPLTDYTITFQDMNGHQVNKDILNVTEKGVVSITSPEVGMKQYQLKATPKTGEQAPQSIVITVYTYDVDRDIYVLDYGLPASLADATQSKLPHGIFTNDDYAAVEQDTVNVSFKGFTDVTEGEAEQYEIKNFESTQGKVRNGTLSVEMKNGGSSPFDATIQFTPTRIMDRVDTYKYKTVVTAQGYSDIEGNITPKEGVVMTEEVKIMPASVVYYEDNFNPNPTNGNDGKNGIVYEGNYPVSIGEGKIPADIFQSINPEEAYGHDDAYHEETGSSPGKTDSMGTSTTLKSSEEVTTTAKFEFTGTGFDIVGRTDNLSPQLVYYVYAQEKVSLNNKDYQKGDIVRFGIVDAFYEGSEEDGLRQIPVIHVQNLPRAKYKVEICVMPGTTESGNGLRFIMDGIRIYNPLSEADTLEYSAAERNAAVTGIRQMILGNTTLDDQGKVAPGTILDNARAAIVYSDGYSAENTFELGATVTEISGVTGSAVSTSQLNDFLVIGPKNELYLPKGSGVAFYVKDLGGEEKEKTLQIEAKAVNTNSRQGGDTVVEKPADYPYPILLNVKQEGKNTEEIPIHSSTAMYYKLSLSGCKSVGQNLYLMILANNSDTDISLTNIKSKGYELAYPTSGIQKLESTKVDSETLTQMQQLYDEKVKGNTTKYPVEITEAAFTAPFAKQGGSVYLNVTMKMNTPAYHPVIYQYEKSDNSTSVLKKLGDGNEDIPGVIDSNTALEPLWSYTRTEPSSGAEGENGKVKNQYYVFKIKLKLQDTKYLADTKYTFVVGAEENRIEETAVEKVVPVTVQAASVWVRATDWSPKITVENKNKPTNQAVAVMIHAGEEILPVEGWTKVDEETYTREYRENGEYSVQVENKGGYRKTLAFSVKNIDKTAPEVNVKVENTKEGKAVVTLTVNEKIQTLKDWIKAEDFVYTKTYMKNGEYSVTVKDLAGNETVVSYKVTGLVEPEEPKDEETDKPGEDSKDEETDKPGEDSKDDEADKPEKEVFSDVRKGDWYYEEVMDVYALKYMTGLNKDFFGAEHTLVRAQFATILYRMAGEPEVDFKDRFADVKEGHFYSDAVTWAYENGIITGYEDSGLFGPNDAITREQMAAVLYRYAKTTGKEMKMGGSLEAFSDSDKVQKFAQKAMVWCVKEGIISGDKGRLNPQGSTIRAEAAAIISRFDRMFAIER